MAGWLLLIYTLPSQPSRKRAYVWRELKKLGAVYLRDGVAVLPAREDLRQSLSQVRDRIAEYEGSADLIDAPPFPPARQSELQGRFNEERASEYRELYHACVRFLRDVLEEVDADQFGFPDVDNLESELARLVRWNEQVTERDYFGGAEAHRVSEILDKCNRAFDRFVHEASTRQSDRAGAPQDDAFERLAGSTNALGDEYPI